MAKKEIESVSDATKSTKTYNSGNLRGVSSDTSQNLADYEKGYTQSDSVMKEKQNLENVQNNKPGNFSSGFESELNSLYDQIKNRGPFTYNMDTDAMYQQYASQYKKNGNRAMKDTIGQASALTGGYGNTYAETAGYQAYSNYMDELNDRAMEFYQMAQDRYDKEGDRLNNLYGLAKDRYDTDYAQFRDNVSDYYNDYSNAYNAYNDERGFDYQQFNDMLSYWQNKAQAENTDWWNQMNFDYQKERNSVLDSQWSQEMDYQKNRDSVLDSQWSQQMDYQKNRDSIADSQWAQQMAYQQNRDSVLDSQWAQEFAETKSNNAYNRSVQESESNYKSLVEAGKSIFNNGNGSLMAWINNMLYGGLVDEDTAAKVIDDVTGNKLSNAKNADELLPILKKMNGMK